MPVKVVMEIILLLYSGFSQAQKPMLEECLSVLTISDAAKITLRLGLDTNVIQGYVLLTTEIRVIN